MRLGPGKLYVKLSRLDLETLDHIGVATAECRGQVARRLIERALYRATIKDVELWRWRKAREHELNRRIIDD